MAPTLVVRLIEPPLFAISTVLLVWLALPGANPLAVTFRPIWRTLTRRRYFLFIGAGVLVIIINTVLTALDHHFTAWVVAARGRDFTALLWSIEGPAVAACQRWTPAPLTWYMTWAYIVVFPIIVPVTMMVFDWLGRRREALAVLIAYMMNYVICLPFYLGVPVRECHAFEPGGRPFLRLVLNDVHPAIMDVLRPMSGLDNCFPSFHTSLAVTMALFALSSGRRMFGLVMSLMAVSIMASTLYLGVHWITDLAAGVVVGVGAYLLGRRLAGRYEPRLLTDTQAGAGQ